MMREIPWIRKQPIRMMALHLRKARLEPGRNHANRYCRKTLLLPRLRGSLDSGYPISRQHRRSGGSTTFTVELFRDYSRWRYLSGYHSNLGYRNHGGWNLGYRNHGCWHLG